MPGMYPDDQLLEIFGKQVMYPGLHPESHKFTDGDFSDPLVKPSHIPAATFNLIIDNLSNLIEAMGFDPNNQDPEQLKKALLHGFSPRIVGEYHLLDHEPSVDELIRTRQLIPRGQLLEIALYEELCTKRYNRYVGDDKNNTALWWYKCDEDGTRNINGRFMRCEDARGLFFRIAGTNSIVRTNMDNPLSAPYDGGEVSSFHCDTMQIITGRISPGFGSENGIHTPVHAAEGALCVRGSSSGGEPSISGSYSRPRGIVFDSSMSPGARTSNETAGAWIAIIATITY